MSNNGTPPLVKVVAFQVVHWAEHFIYKDEETNEDKPGVRQIILIYAQGEDGIMYEYSGGWVPLPIDKANMKKPQAPPPKVIKR